MKIQTMKEWRAANPYYCKRLPKWFFKQEAELFVSFFKNTPEALMFEEYYIARGLPKPTFEGWLKKNALLQEAYEEVRIILAVRREKGMLYGKLREKPALMSLYRYNSDWKDICRFWAEVKQSEQQESGIKIVEIPVFGDAKTTTNKV